MGKAPTFEQKNDFVPVPGLKIMIPDIAILICAFNPPPDLLARTLSGLQRLILPTGKTWEVIIVDNNSAPPLNENALIHQFLAAVPQARLVSEPRQGLSHARFAAFAASHAPWVVFVDMDVELSPQYLLALSRLQSQYPQVSVWGAGTIQVQFTHPTPANLRKQFSERSIQAPVIISNIADLFNPPPTNRSDGLKMKVMNMFNPAIPYGMGMVLHRAAFTHYQQAVQARSQHRTGRAGTYHGGADDVQMDFEAVRGGYPLGIAPDLQLQHWIPPSRTRPETIHQSAYAAGMELTLALVECFPEKTDEIINPLCSPGPLFIALFSSAMRDLFINPGVWARVIQIIGRCSGVMKIKPGAVPPFIPFLIRQLKLDGYQK